MCVHIFELYVYIYVYTISWPNLFMIGDDRVIRYTGEDDVAG